MFTRLLQSALMYLRFVISDRDPDSHSRLGIFQASYDLLQDPTITKYDEAELRNQLTRLEDNLKIPDRFARSTKNNAHNIAISWYKDSARECIECMHAICHILNEYGRVTEIIQTDRPGYIVYEDFCQIVAEPFADTNT